MFDSLKGPVLYCATLIVVAVLAVCAVLAWRGVLTGDQVIGVVSVLLTAVAGTGGAAIGGIAGASTPTVSPVPVKSTAVPASPAPEAQPSPNIVVTDQTAH